MCYLWSTIVIAGKIEKTDWNVREIEKKILENKMGHGIKRERPEKVPKWSREQFDDKVNLNTQLTWRLYLMAVKHRQHKTKCVWNEFRQASSSEIYGTGCTCHSDCALLLELSFILPDTRFNFLVLRGWCLHTQAETASCLKALYISTDGCAVTCCCGRVLGSGFSYLVFWVSYCARSVVTVLMEVLTELIKSWAWSGKNLD